MRLLALCGVLTVTVAIGLFFGEIRDYLPLGGSSNKTSESISAKESKQSKSTPAVSVAARTYQQNQSSSSTAGGVAPLPPRTIPLSSTPLDRVSAEELARFPGARVVHSAQVVGPGANQSTLVRILETDFKYPYVRTEEVVDNSTGQVISREEMVADHVLVTLAEGEDPGSLLASMGLSDVRMERVTPYAPLYRLHLSAATLSALPEALNALDGRAGLVLVAEPDFVRQGLLVPNDPKYADGTLWGLNQISDADIDAPEAWDVRSSAGNVIVAVIDTGIRYTHQDLAANMWRNPNEIAGNGVDDDRNGFVDDVYGCNAYARTGNPMDDQGHGSHCAGTIGGVGNNGVGVTGVAWGVKLMACKFLSATGSGTDSDAVTCIDYARAKGAKVLSCSWGGGGAGASLQAAIERARTAGVIMIAAAGNESNNNDANPSYPASYPHDNIVAVAATTRTDGLASFSNYGATQVDLGAPGEGIYSTVSTSDTAYATYSGTSMATPHVAGVVALLAAQYTSDTYANLIQRLLNGTDAIPALVGKAKAGRLNLAKALGSNPNPPVVRPANDSFASATAVSGTAWNAVADSTQATAETGEPSHAGQAAGKSVWYVWTAAASGSASIQTAGSGFDTVLAVYTGSSLTGLTAVGSNDNRVAGATDSLVAFSAVAGTTYRIAVDGKSGASGAVKIGGTLAGVTLANDALANAVVCTGNSFAVTGSNVGATKQAGEPSHAGNTGGKSIWYAWTATASGKLTLATAGSNFDTLLGVYTGTLVSALKSVVSNDDVSSTDRTSKVVFTVTAGTKYWFAVDGYGGASGTTKLAGTFAPKVVLASPAGVTSTQDSAGKVTITWQAVSGAASYDVTLSSGATVMASGRVTGLAVKTSGALSRTAVLTANVRAVNAEGEPGEWSGEKPTRR